MDRIVTEIVSVLVDKGRYALLASPMRIADMSFRFDAALLGGDGEGDLVIVQSLSADSDAILRRRVVALVTLLDRQKAMKPVTLVLVVRGTVPKDIGDLEQVSRVILLTPSTSLDSALRPLLRLILPNADKRRFDAEVELRTDLGAQCEDAFVSHLLAASRSGSEAVTDVLSKEFESAVNPLITTAKL